MLAKKEKEINKYFEELNQGKKESFSLLVRLIADDVVNIAYYYVDNIEDAKDIAQEVFIKIYKKYKTFRYQSSISTWVYRIAVNSALDFLRRKKEIVTINENITVDAKTIRDIKDNMEEKDRKKIIQKAINSLPARQRETIILKHFEGLKIKEISKILGCSQSSVKTHLLRGLGKLKEILGGENEVFV